jgi:hypothetical protein
MPFACFWVTDQRKLAESEAASFSIDDFAAKAPGSKHAKRFHTIDDYTQAFRAGQTDPVAVATSILSAIKDADSKPLPIRAMIQIHEVRPLALLGSATWTDVNAHLRMK